MDLLELKNDLKELKQLATLQAKTALNMNDVSFLTGLSKSHIYKLVCNKQIPYYKSEGGKMTYFHRQEVSDWLLAHRVSTNAELESQAVNYCVTSKRKK